MKTKFTVKQFTALLFLLFLAVNFLLGLYPFALGTYRMLRDMAHGEKLNLETVEYTFNDSFPAKGFLITVNGGLQRMLGARNLNYRVLQNNGHLTYTIDREEVSGFAADTLVFAEALEARGIPFVYVNAPFKVCAEDKQLPVGIEDWSNENVDDFLNILRENEVDVLDLRASMRQDGLDHYSHFYRTDHHWTAEAGFWAVSKIGQHLSLRDSSFQIDSRVTDLENYDLTVYENIFLGSAGRRVGPLFAGKDDLTLIRPKFETSFRFRSESEDMDRAGNYDETLLFMEKLTEGGDFDGARYNVYCGQDFDRLDVTNLAAQQGLEVTGTPKRLLVFKDSFCSVVIPFLALGYDETCYVDMRLYEGDILELVEQYRPDAVLVLYNGGAVTASNANMFEFVK